MWPKPEPSQTSFQSPAEKKEQVCYLIAFLFATKDPTCFKLLYLKYTFPVVLICVWVRTSQEQGLPFDSLLVHSSPRGLMLMPQPILLPSSIPPPTGASRDHLPDQLPALKILITGPLLEQPWVSHIERTQGLRAGMLKNTIFFIFIDNWTVTFSLHSTGCLKKREDACECYHLGHLLKTSSTIGSPGFHSWAFSPGPYIHWLNVPFSVQVVGLWGTFYCSHIMLWESLH